MNRNYSALTAMILVMALVATIFGAFLREPATSRAETTENKVIYLTFDDGPSDRVTPKILDTLKDEGVKATFFIVGQNAATRKEIVKRMKREGHALGVHSYTHEYNEIYASEEALLRDIQKCNDVIKRITGEYSSLYRFPGGSYTVAPELIAAVKAKGYKCMDWNASFRDSEIPSATADDLYEAAVSTIAYPQSVIMLAHDATDKSATAEALKKVIQHFKSLNYEFKTL